MTDYNALRRAVIGPIAEDRYMWRINWLKSLLDAFETGDVMISPKCDDPSAVRDCIGECSAMVHDVSEVLADWPQISRAVVENLHRLR